MGSSFSFISIVESAALKVAGGDPDRAKAILRENAEKLKNEAEGALAVTYQPLDL